MRSLIRAVLLLVSSAAHADTIALDAGFGSTWLATPDESHDTSRLTAAFSLAAGADLKRTLHVELRGDVVVGNGDIAALGPHLRHQWGSWFVGYGLAIARVLGPEELARAEGIGLAASLRAGYRIGDVTLALHALPIWVFASDSPVYEATLRGAVELGVSLGIHR